MKRIALGIIIIIIGVALLLMSLNIGNARQLFETWWPLALIAIGVVNLRDATRQGSWWPVLTILFGGLLLATNVFDVSINVWNIFWPAVVILFGLSFLLQNKKSPDDSTAASEGDITALLGGVNTRNSSHSYNGNRLTAVMGGIELDISKATIKSGAIVHVMAVMGGVDIRVPEHVIVKNRATNILSGFEDKTCPVDSKDAPVLYIDGTILLGGVEIKR